ncbi:MAG: hypothetical protein ABI132_09895 [Rhodanobacteraceae bacterium]
MNTTPERNIKNISLDGQPNDRAVETRAREIFGDACAHVDARIGARLASARREALAAAPQPSHPRIWLPAAGAVAACALALGVLWFHADPGSTANMHAQKTQLAAATDAGMPIDADAEQLDLYQNLDFYQWLAQQPNARAPDTGAKQ